VALDIPAVIAGKYRYERVLGQGGMGVVIEARHTTLDERVAIKMLLPEYAAHDQATARFLREAKAAARIKSPHVARVSDVGALDSGIPYMVMEFLEGSDVAAILAERGRLPASDAVEYVIQAADAIAEAHALGIVHRDLKPANLFVAHHSDGSPYVKVLDFGISKMADDSADSLTRTTATMGSAYYMSPEQIRQARSVDRRTDVYALGVTLYEMLAGRPPFVAESFAGLCVEVATGTAPPLRSLRPDLPEELAAVIERAFARDREHRQQSIAELVVALAPWAPGRVHPIIERISRAGALGAPTAGSASATPPMATPPMAAAPAVRADAGTAAQFASAATNANSAITQARPARRLLPAILIASAGLVSLGLVAGGWALLRSRATAEVPEGAASTDVAATLPLPASEQPAVEPELAPEPAPTAPASEAPAAASAPPPSAAAAPAVRAPAGTAKPSKPSKPAAGQPGFDPYGQR
jgi:eukaryotic-like serine/threonine-protein kinase